LNEALGGACSGCHSVGGNPDFTDVGSDAIYKIIPVHVTPGQPERSFLFVKINCQNPGRGARMPLGRAPLSINQQGLIYDWIRQGAYGEDPSNSIPRSFIFRDGMESMR
jgi:hypothetical protein